MIPWPASPDVRWLKVGEYFPQTGGALVAARGNFRLIITREYTHTHTHTHITTPLPFIYKPKVRRAHTHKLPQPLATLRHFRCYFICESWFCSSPGSEISAFSLSFLNDTFFTLWTYRIFVSTFLGKDTLQWRIQGGGGLVSIMGIPDPPPPRRIRRSAPALVLA